MSGIALSKKTCLVIWVLVILYDHDQEGIRPYPDPHPAMSSYCQFLLKISIVNLK